MHSQSLLKAGFPPKEIYEFVDGKITRRVQLGTDYSWKSSLESLAALGLTTLEPWGLDEIARESDGTVTFEIISSAAFEAQWNNAEWSPDSWRAREEMFETIDTTRATDPAFERVTGTWTRTAPNGQLEVIEFTLNGIAMHHQGDANVQFRRYRVEPDSVVLCDEATGHERSLAFAGTAPFKLTARRPIDEA